MDVWAHAVQCFQSINGSLRMALWGRNVFQQINRKYDFNDFLQILNVIVNDMYKKRCVCILDGSEWGGVEV
jgi:hypothetical protein